MYINISIAETAKFPLLVYVFKACLFDLTFSGIKMCPLCKLVRSKSWRLTVAPQSVYWDCISYNRHPLCLCLGKHLFVLEPKYPQSGRETKSQKDLLFGANDLLVCDCEDWRSETTDVYWLCLQYVPPEPLPQDWLEEWDPVFSLTDSAFHRKPWASALAGRRALSESLWQDGGEMGQLPWWRGDCSQHLSLSHTELLALGQVIWQHLKVHPRRLLWPCLKSWQVNIDWKQSRCFIVSP